MAGIKEKLRKKSKPLSSNGQDWSRSGTFINKPARGWLHQDDQLHPDAGICYGVRYIGCMGVQVSMRSLDFEMRTAVAKESISRVCDAAGLKTASKKSKKDKKISKFLGEQPQMDYAGANVNLTITTDSLMLTIMESGVVIANHLMPGISFASGGDPDTMDFVAYVAKDEINGRACHVLECGGGLAQDVITTVGQAFELRYKEYIKHQPKAVNLPDRLEHPVFHDEESAWGEDPEYYNDRPGVKPPSPTCPPVPPLPQYTAIASNLPVSDGIYSSIKHQIRDIPQTESATYENKDSMDASVGTLIDFSDENGFYDNSNSNNTLHTTQDGVYDNTKNDMVSSGTDGNLYDNKPDSTSSDDGVNDTKTLDAFNMQPFDSTLQPPPRRKESQPTQMPDNEDWFHGPLSRKQAEYLLKEDGDFLVRESTNSAGQYVLSGLQNGHAKHLLLVDPEGVVRTKDRAFDSVSHLINYHLTKNIPITSQESELLLRNAISSQC